MKVNIKITPHGTSGKYYQIFYKEIKRYWIINLFTSWKRMEVVWISSFGDKFEYNQPVLISNYNDALEYGKKLKNNPKLIEKHWKKQNKIYNDCKQKILNKPKQKTTIL